MIKLFKVIFEGQANASVVSSYYDGNIALEGDDDYAVFVSEHGVAFPEPGYLHGSCSDNANECRKMTISSTVCFNRNDIERTADFDGLTADFNALNLFSDYPSFVSNSLAVANVKPNFNDEDTEEHKTSKGSEGDSTWFRFNFFESVSDGNVVSLSLS